MKLSKIFYLILGTDMETPETKTITKKQYEEAIALIGVVAYGDEVSFPDEDRAKALLKELGEE